MLYIVLEFNMIQHVLAGSVPIPQSLHVLRFIIPCALFVGTWVGQAATTVTIDILR